MINLVVYTFPSYNQELFYNPNLRSEESWLHTFVKLPHLYRVPLILVILGSLDILAPLITWSSTLRGLPSRSCKYQRISWGSGLAWNWIATVNSDPTSPPSNPVFLASFWDGLAKSKDKYNFKEWFKCNHSSNSVLNQNCQVRNTFAFCKIYKPRTVMSKDFIVSLATYSSWV